MRALVLRSFGQMDLAEVPDAPAPEPHEARIRIRYTGICGSDIHGYTGENGRRSPGQIMGHETVGHVESLGSETDGHGLYVGQLVTFNPLISCGTCEACAAGREQHCPDRLVIGVDADFVSAFAEQVTLPAHNVVPLGDVDPRYGALVEPLAVALHACRRGGVSAGATVLVTGGGPIGQSVILAALRGGADQVVATDVSASRRALCERLGAVALDPSAAPVGEQVRERLGHPVDVTIDAVGISATLGDAMSATKLGGTVALVGMGAQEVTLSAFKISTEERSLVGSFAYDRRTFQDTTAWVSEGGSTFDNLISEIVPMDGAGATFRTLAEGGDVAGKVLVDLEA